MVNQQKIRHQLPPAMAIAGLIFSIITCLILPGQAAAQRNQNKFQQLRTLAQTRTSAPQVMAVQHQTPLNLSSHSHNNLFNVEEIQLHEAILRGYHEAVRPAHLPNETIKVMSRIFPMKIQDLIEKEEILHLSTRLQFGWSDKRLSWNPANYSGLKTTILPGSSVWIPDLQFINSADDMYSILGSRQFAVKVHYNGEVWWHPTGSIKLRCELDLRLFPYDQQSCKVILESVIYTHEQLNMTIRKDKTVSFSMYRDNGLWEVTAGFGYAMLDWATASTAFSRVEFVINMKRRTSYYVNNYIIPCFLLSLLQVLTFLIPLKNPERLTHSTSVLLSLIVFQTIIFSELPKTAETMPLLARYLMALSIVSVLAIAGCVAVTYLMSVAEKYSKKTRIMEVPTFVVKILNLRVVPDAPSALPESNITTTTSGTIINSNNNNNNNNGGVFIRRGGQPLAICDCSSPGVANQVGTSASSTTCNGHIANHRHQSRIVYVKGESSVVTVGKNGKNKKKICGSNKVRAAQLYRHLAKQIDNISLFTCAAVVFCVPIALFIITPAVMPNEPRLQGGH